MNKGGHEGHIHNLLKAESFSSEKENSVCDEKGDGQGQLLIGKGKFSIIIIDLEGIDDVWMG